MKKFELGRVVTTKGVYEECMTNRKFFDFVATCLGMYTRCDWGSTCSEDAQLNDSAVESGDRIFAVYVGAEEKTIWIITESDRSITTILFPSEY